MGDGDMANDITIQTLTDTDRPFYLREVRRLMPRVNSTDRDRGGGHLVPAAGARGARRRAPGGARNVHRGQSR